MKIFKTFLSCIFLFLLFLSFIPCPSGADILDNWIPIASGTDNWLYGLAYGNNTFIAVGLFSTIVTSSDQPDYLSWQSSTSGVDPHHLNGITYGNGTFVAVGVLGTILTSTTNGASWDLRDSGTSHYLQGAAYGNGTFVVVGGSGTILTSPTGETWTNILGPNDYLMGVTYGNGVFVAVGASGTILTSTDNGAHWNLRYSGTDKSLMGVAYGNSTFVAVGETGTILTASETDLAAWTDRTLELTDWINGIAFANGTFVAVGESGRIFSAPGTDLNIWTERVSGTTNDLEAVTYGSGKFAALGGLGTILLDYGQDPVYPVRIWRAMNMNFSSIGDAYVDASPDEIIQTQAVQLDETLFFNINKPVTLIGGFNSTYSSNPAWTVVNGSLTIGKGTVTVENIVIQ